jgi:mRNA interferase MazF
VTAGLKRGAVVTVRLDAGQGSEIRDTRPAAVVSNDAACHFDAVVQIVPITRLPERALRPYESRVESPGSGLTRPSRLVANQIRTVSKHRIGTAIGRLDPAEVEALDRALEIQLALGRRRSEAG